MASSAESPDMFQAMKALKRQKRREERALELEELKPPQPLSALEALPPPKKVIGPSGREYHGRSLCCMRVHDQPRRGAIQMVESRWFDPLILITILTNCVTMAWESPLDPTGTPKAALIDVMEWIYLYIFTIELMSKIIAYGFAMHEGSYLRDSWCQLDFVVVTLAWIPILFPSFGNYSVIRSVRALRPLRALKRVPGMPQMISAIMAAMPKCVAFARVCAICPACLCLCSMTSVPDRQCNTVLTPAHAPLPTLHDAGSATWSRYVPSSSWSSV